MNEPLQPAVHPDADTLSAFAENALPAHERTRTLTHLAACAACREIVFLAQQAAPLPTTAPEPLWQRWRNSLPLFGIGIGAAALACAGLLFVTLRPHPTAAPTESARVQPPASPAPQPIQPRTALKGTGFSPYAMKDKKTSGALAPEGPAVGLPRPPAKPLPPSIATAPQPIMVGRAFVGANSSSNYVAGAGAAGGMVAAPARPAAVSLGAGSGSALPPPSAAASTAAPMPAPPPSANETVEVQSAGQALGTETPRGNTALADEARVSGTLAAEKKSRQRSAQSSLQLDALAAPAPAVRAPLPSKLSVAVTVSSGARTLAADTAGALFLSLDAGRHWQTVTPQWNGKVAQLRLAPAKNPPAPLTLDATAADDSKPAAQPAAKLPAAPPEFQLVTAAGAVWTSTDGLSWRPSR